MALSLLKLMQIWCSDKFAFLFCIQNVTSNLSQVRFKFASTFALFLTF